MPQGLLRVVIHHTLSGIALTDAKNKDVKLVQYLDCDLLFLPKKNCGIDQNAVIPLQIQMRATRQRG